RERLTSRRHCFRPARVIHGKLARCIDSGQDGNLLFTRFAEQPINYARASLIGCSAKRVKSKFPSWPESIQRANFPWITRAGRKQCLLEVSRSRRQLISFSNRFAEAPTRSPCWRSLH